MRPVVLLAAVLLATACSDDPPAAPPVTAVTVTPQRIAETVQAELGGVALRLEVADEPAERQVGLMGRSSVPEGTGMVFRFGEPVRTTFWMHQVPVPLVAVFLRDGVAVHVAQMAPCREADSARCPLYGPDGEPFDTVVETAPETLPDVEVGDRYAER